MGTYRGKVVYICPYYGRIGGMQHVAEVLYKRLNVDSIMLSCDSQVSEKSEKGLISLKSVRLFSSPFAFRLFDTLWRNLRQGDIVHLHIAQAFLPEITWLACKLKKIPYIAHFHIDVGRSGWFGMLIKIYKKTFLKRVLQDALKVIVPTQSYKRIAEEKYGAENVKVIANGIDADCYRKSKRKGRNILFVGRLALQKDPYLLLDGFRLFQKEKKGYGLVIVGEGSLEKDLKKKVKHQNIKNVVFRGGLYGKELIDTYYNADYFVMTSERESFGIVALEAMASGLPMVLADLPELREVTQGNAVFVKRNAHALCKGLKKIVEDGQLCRKLSKKGVKIAEKYDWSRVLEKYSVLYE